MGSNDDRSMPGTKTLRIVLPAAMGSATTDDETIGAVLGTNARITGARFIPAAAVTANGTNFSTLNVRNRKADASGSALPASRSWAATNSTAFVADTATLSATASDLLASAGDIITVSRVHTASGVVIPAGVVEVDYLIR
jgi:hypothetical protein